MAANAETNVKLGVDSSEVSKAAIATNALGISTDKAAVSTANLTKKSQGLTAAARSAKLAISGVIATYGLLKVGGFFASAAMEANKFGVALAELQTLMGKTQNMDQYRSAAKELANEFGVNAKEQLQGFYQAVSAGTKGYEKQMDLMKTANKLASGGVTSMASSIDILTTSLNVYASQNLTAADAADILFTGVKEGKTTMDELSHGMGKVLPIAKDMGLSLSDTTAAVAALTKSGLSTREAITNLRGMLAAVARPSMEARKVAAELGLEWNATALRAQGLEQFIKNLNEKVGDNTEAMVLLSGGVEGYTASANLASDGTRYLSETLDAMGGRLGAATEAFEIMDSTAQEAIDKMGASWSNLKETIGRGLEDEVKATADAFAGMFASIDEWIQKSSSMQDEMSELYELIRRYGGDEDYRKAYMTLLESRSRTKEEMLEVLREFAKPYREMAEAAEEARVYLSTLEGQIENVMYTMNYSRQEAEMFLGVFNRLPDEIEETTVEIRELSAAEKALETAVAGANEILDEQAKAAFDSKTQKEKLALHVGELARIESQLGQASGDARVALEALRGSVVRKIEQILAAIKASKELKETFAHSTREAGAYKIVLTDLGFQLQWVASSEEQASTAVDGATKSIREQAQESSLAAMSKQELADKAGKASAAEITLKDILEQTNAATDDQTEAAQQLKAMIELVEEAIRNNNEEVLEAIRQGRDFEDVLEQIGNAGGGAEEKLGRLREVIGDLKTKWKDMTAVEKARTVGGILTAAQGAFGSDDARERDRIGGTVNTGVGVVRVLSGEITGIAQIIQGVGQMRSGFRSTPTQTTGLAIGPRWPANPQHQGQDIRFASGLQGRLFNDGGTFDQAAKIAKAFQQVDESIVKQLNLLGIMVDYSQSNPFDGFNKEGQDVRGQKNAFFAHTQEDGRVKSPPMQRQLDIFAEQFLQDVKDDLLATGKVTTEQIQTAMLGDATDIVALLTQINQDIEQKKRAKAEEEAALAAQEAAHKREINDAINATEQAEIDLRKSYLDRMQELAEEETTLREQANKIIAESSKGKLDDNAALHKSLLSILQQNKGATGAGKHGVEHIKSLVAQSTISYGDALAQQAQELYQGIFPQIAAGTVDISQLGTLVQLMDQLGDREDNPLSRDKLSAIQEQLNAIDSLIVTQQEAAAAALIEQAENIERASQQLTDEYQHQINKSNQYQARLAAMTAATEQQIERQNLVIVSLKNLQKVMDSISASAEGNQALAVEYARRQADALERWDGDGLPPVRT